MATFYLEPSELTARFGADEVAKWAEFGADLTLVAADACGEAQAYLSARYSAAQLQDMPYEVKGAVADLVRYRVYGDSASQLVISRAEQARQFLRDLGAGKAAITLADNPATPEDETASETASFTASPRLFSRTELAGW